MKKQVFYGVYTNQMVNNGNLKIILSDHESCSCCWLTNIELDFETCSKLGNTASFDLRLVNLIGLGPRRQRSSRHSWQGDGHSILRRKRRYYVGLFT